MSARCMGSALIASTWVSIALEEAAIMRHTGVNRFARKLRAEKRRSGAILYRMKAGRGGFKNRVGFLLHMSMGR